MYMKTIMQSLTINIQNEGRNKQLIIISVLQYQVQTLQPYSQSGIPESEIMTKRAVSSCYLCSKLKEKYDFIFYSFTMQQYWEILHVFLNRHTVMILIILGRT